MNTVFMNSGNNKTPNPHRLIFQKKLIQKEVINMLLYQIVAYPMHRKT